MMDFVHGVKFNLISSHKNLTFWNFYLFIVSSHSKHGALWPKFHHQLPLGNILRFGTNIHLGGWRRVGGMRIRFGWFKGQSLTSCPVFISHELIYHVQFLWHNLESWMNWLQFKFWLTATTFSGLYLQRRCLYLQSRCEYLCCTYRILIAYL